MHGHVRGHGNRQFPEAGRVVAFTGVGPAKLGEIVANWKLDRDRDLVNQRAPLILEVTQPLEDLVPGHASVGGAGVVVDRAVHLHSQRIPLANEAVAHQLDVTAHRLQERVDHLPSVTGRQVILVGCAEVGDPGGLGRGPALVVINSPGMHHDHRGLGGPQVIRDLNDSPRVVREPPCPNRQVGSDIVHQRWGFKSPLLDHRFDELRMIGQQGGAIRQFLQRVVIHARLFRRGRGLRGLGNPRARQWGRGERAGLRRVPQQ